MTTGQKIIKYMAVAFALFLSISILSGICSAIFTVTGLMGGTATGDMKGYVIEGDFTDLKIDVSVAELEIKTADEWKFETNSKYIELKEENGKLEIRENRPSFVLRPGGSKAILTIPEDTVLEYADIDTGVGEVTIDGLSADVLVMDIGIGEVNAKKVEVLNKAEIDYGIGETNLGLKGSALDYQISLDKGIGEAMLENQEMQYDCVYGYGNRRIEIDGGIGELNIIFE